MADRQGEPVAPVCPAQQLAEVGVIREPQHGPMPTWQVDGNVGRVVGHGISHEIRKTGWQFNENLKMAQRIITYGHKSILEKYICINCLNVYTTSSKNA